MDKYQGDLTDILRAGRGSLSQSHGALSSWEFAGDTPIDLSSGAMEDQSNNTGDNFFGDPFCDIRDPLLHELNMVGPSSYYRGARSSTDDQELIRGASIGNNMVGCHQNDIVFAEEVPHKSSPSCNINMFSRIQISPAAGTNTPVMAPPVAAASPSPRGFKAAAMVPSDIVNANISQTCLIDSTGQVQISSPRNLGIKRRKSQAKKVVCIPAPAAPNSRPSGEVVPSDLWAWRKYGQKPIKGSPYPRGYYRCSSSKGCSARKQVERSRTDPNMLVITYTSEHNHPWPTQRNALAGSTRSQPPKANNNAVSKTSPTTSSQAHKTSKEEQTESSNDTLSPTLNVASSSTGIKEEFEDTREKELQMEDPHELSTEGFPQSYRPELPDSGQSDQDFFADLGEIDGDPLDLLFSQGFNEYDHHQEKQGNPYLDPFGLFDWPEDNNNATSFEEAKRGL